jgi:hypothetical protein
MNNENYIKSNYFWICIFIINIFYYIFIYIYIERDAARFIIMISIVK